MAIKFINVKYAYKKNNEVLKDINLDIKGKSIISIIGLGGSGKTTLANLFNGTIIQTAGRIKIDKFEISNEIKDYKELKFNACIVHQNPEDEILNLTVKEEIGFYLDYYNYKKDIKEKHIKDALKMVGLANSYLDKNPFTLSEGEMKKVALASALALNPKIIILDEPTVGLDSKSCENIIKIIRLLKNRFNKTIILVSNDVNLVHKLSDYIYVLANGKIIKSGTKYEIFTDSEFLEKNNIDTPQVIKFSKMVLDKKNIKLGYRDDINDLLKDIYRFK